MSTKKKVLLMVGIALAGGLLFMMARTRRSASPTPAIEKRVKRYETAARAVEEARARRDRLHGEVAALEKGERELRVKVEELRPKEGAAKAGTGAKESDGRFAVMLRNASQLQAEETLTNLKARLGLSPEQQEKIRALFAREAEKVSAALEKGDVSPLWQAENVETSPSHRAELAQILTPAQLADYDRYNEESKRKMQDLVVHGHVLELSQRLGLDDAQSKTIEAALKSEPEHCQQILSFGGFGLSQDAESGFEDYRKSAHRVRTILAPLVTGPQLAKLEDYLKDREAEHREMADLMRMFVTPAKQ